MGNVPHKILPVLKTVPTLYEHQRKALEAMAGPHGIQHQGFALIMEMGTGKTKVIIERTYQLFTQEFINAVVVVAPNNVHSQWVYEQFTTHYPDDTYTTCVWGNQTKAFNHTFLKDLHDYNKLFVFAVNIEALSANSVELYIKQVFAIRDVFFVIDESTRIKNARRKPVRGRRAGAKGANRVLDWRDKASFRAILTGTPITKSPFDLWAQYEFLQPNFFKMDYFMFTRTYGVMVRKRAAQGRTYNALLDEDTFKRIKRIVNEDGLNPNTLARLAAIHGMQISDVIYVANAETYAPYKNLDKLKDIISRVTFFCRKQDCMDLPDKVYVRLDVTMSKAQIDVYTRMKKELWAEYAGKELTLTTKLVLTARLQAITGGVFVYDDDTTGGFSSVAIADNAKLTALLDDLEGIADDVSIIVWAAFRKEIEIIHTALVDHGYSAEMYYGGSEESVINRFKAKETRILVSTVKKGGEGLNLQVSTLQYFYSNSFRGDKRQQAEDRSHRAGQTNKVTYKDIICKNTVDERVYNVIKERGELIDYFKTASVKDILV